VSRSDEGWFWAAGHIVGNVHEWSTVYGSDGELYPSREAAIAAGFKRADASDDFNVGRVVSGELVWFGWMDEQHPPDEYGEVAADLRSSGLLGGSR
jgi:hypothetical protein